MGSKAAFVTLFVCMLLIATPLAIASIILGVQSPGTCDKEDVMGLNVGEWLIGSGASQLIIVVLSALFVGLMMADVMAELMMVALLIVTVLAILFGMAWFIIGGVVLFRGNIECIREVSSHVIFALVLWCISALRLLQDCCGAKKNTSENSN